jgi:membrane protein implicated in regulation of membrane protease activity
VFPKTRNERRLLLRYLLFQLPGWLLLGAGAVFLYRGFGVSPWLGTGALALWVLKDLVLFPFVKNAYRRDAPSERRLVGLRGIAAQRLEPEGWVRIRGELWAARLAPGCAPVETGGTVAVRDVEGLTLVVEPAPRD